MKFEGGRYDTVVVKLKEENLMYSAVREKEMEERKAWTCVAPDLDVRRCRKGRSLTARGSLALFECFEMALEVDITGLQSESAKWMNGQKAIVVCWDRDIERYEAYSAPVSCFICGVR